MQSEEEEDLLEGGGLGEKVEESSLTINIPIVQPSKTAAVELAPEELALAENQEDKTRALVADEVLNDDSFPTGKPILAAPDASTTNTSISAASNSTANIQLSNTTHSCTYLKNWLVRVVPIPPSDPFAALLGCEHWIVLHGTIENAPSFGRSATAPLSSIPLSASLHTSPWICRVLTENSVQSIDGAVYTLLGEMDKASTFFLGKILAFKKEM